MSQVYGWVGKILCVDLTRRSTRTLDTLDYAPKYIGGRGIAARLGWEFIRPNIKPFAPENPLMILTGPLSGTTAPFSGRTSVCGLSPQGWPSEWFGRSNFGGHWGPSLKYAGYDGLLVQGIADRPIILWIHEDQVEFLDARHVWGKGSIDTQKILIDELGKDVRVLTIGQAGENRCRISIISTETESAAGQGGFGAVMGSKNLKAIAVRGSGPIYIAQPDLFYKRCKAITEEARTGSRFAETSLDPQLVKKFKQRWQACTQQCAMKCGGGCRFYEMNGPVTGEKIAGQFHCVSNFFPGIANSFYDWKMEFDGAFETRHHSDNYGINQWDLLLGIVPWLKLCQLAGYINTYNGRKMDFNDPVFWEYVMRSIAYREGLGDALAEGGRRAPEIVGFGKELADELYAAWGSAGHWDGHGDRGNLIVYPFWITQALQWAVDVRDPFSSAHGYSSMTMHWSPLLDKERGLSWDIIKSVGKHIYGTEKPVDPTSDYEDKEVAAVWHGHRSVLKDSVTVDDNMFPMILSFNYPDGRARALDMEGVNFEYHLFTSATGQDLSLEELNQACERIFNLERAIQIRNFDRQRSDDEMVIPYFELDEWWENPYLGKKMQLEREKFLALLEKYYHLRGWDLIRARPTSSKLGQLGLEDVAEELVKDRKINPEEKIEA